MLLELVWQYNTKPVNSFYSIRLVPHMDGSTTPGTVWDFTLPGDQNEVFESLVDFQKARSFAEGPAWIDGRSGSIGFFFFEDWLCDISVV